MPSLVPTVRVVDGLLRFVQKRRLALVGLEGVVACSLLAIDADCDNAEQNSAESTQPIEAERSILGNRHRKTNLTIAIA
jgi:hypothetical protein